jgi:hypothetical protein
VASVTWFRSWLVALTATAVTVDQKDLPPRIRVLSGGQIVRIGLAAGGYRWTMAHVDAAGDRGQAAAQVAAVLTARGTLGEAIGVVRGWWHCGNGQANRLLATTGTAGRA